MNHDEIRQKLFALLDGPLSEKERALVEEHLPACGDCRAALGQYRRIASVLFPPAPHSEFSEDIFVSKVMARLSPAHGLSAQAAPTRWNTLQWLLPLAGSALAAAWVFFSVLPGTPGLPSSSPEEEVYFSQGDTNLSSQLTVMPASATEDMVVALIR